MMISTSTITEKQLPAIIPMEGQNPEAFVEHFLANQTQYDALLKEHGAIKFTQVAIDSTETFARIVKSISSNFLDYLNGTSPRTRLSGKVYTSTEYIATEKIPLHNELSYAMQWPGKLFFSCIDVAEEGGATTLADSREVLAKMDQGLVEEIEAKGVTYIRNLHGGFGMGLSWQQAFETENKAEFEAYCAANDIQFTWKEDDAVQICQNRKGVINSRNTGEKLWFNQIDQFHPFQLGEETFEAMLELYDSPEALPNYVTYGDGSTISNEVFALIQSTYDACEIAPLWNKDELLIVDNELAMHGRSPYGGNRKVVVSMSA